MKDQCTGGVLKDSSGNAVYAPVPDPFGDITSNSAFRILLPGSSLTGLTNFFHGGKFDYQRFGTDGTTIDRRFLSISTIGIGYYSSLNLIGEGGVLAMQDLYASRLSTFGDVQMDAYFTHLPVTNVQNTRIGFQQARCGRH